MTDKKIPDEKQIDLTEARHKRCLPIILSILQQFLDAKLPLADRTYIEQRVLECLNILYRGMAIEHFNEIFETIDHSLKMSYEAAQEKVWGKPFNELTVEDLDKMLKTGAEIQKNS